MTIAQFASMTPEQAAAFMPNAQRQPARTRLAQIVGRGSVIDVGCGKGEEVSALFTPDQYLGIDVSAPLIALAKQRNPGYQFRVARPQDLYEERRWEYAIVKSVLEHLPDVEAVWLYRAARRICRKLLVCWHTEPSERPEYRTYEGELGTMQQNRHDVRRFTGTILREPIGQHVIWKVT